MNRASLLLILALSVSGRAAEKSEVVVDKDKRTVTIDAKVAPRKINDPAYMGKIYPIEVIACWAYPKGQKAHETVVTIEAKPGEVHKALETLGLKPGKPVVGDVKEGAQGPAVNVYIEVPTSTGTRRVPVEKVLIDPRSGKSMPKVKWIFTGSAMKKPDPQKDEKVYGADLTGTLIAIFPVTDETVMQTSLTMKEEKYLKLETDTKVLPKEGSPVKLVLEVAK